jgi:hypothetical protein
MRGFRRVVDVFEVANDSNRTLVAGATGRTGASPCPKRAGTEIERRRSSAEAFRFAPEQAELLVPFRQGASGVSRYAIPARGTVTVP